MRRSAVDCIAMALLCYFCAAAAMAVVKDLAGDGEGIQSGGRLLLGIKETKGNTSFRCTPSGPCLPCQYSEKTDEKYHCSETGYRVPLKCVEIKEKSKDGDSKVGRRLLDLQLKLRKLLDNSSTSQGGVQNYVTYRSCLPVDGQEKLSFFGFEVIMAGLLLISGPFMYLRRKRTTVMPSAGAIRLPTSPPRF